MSRAGHQPIREERTMLRYRGVNRRGVAEVGTIEFRPSRLAGVVQGFYDRRYRTLEVFDGAVQVAGISQNEDTRRRTWWAEWPSRDDVPSRVVSSQPTPSSHDQVGPDVSVSQHHGEGAA